MKEQTETTDQKCPKCGAELVSYGHAFKKWACDSYEDNDDFVQSRYCREKELKIERDTALARAEAAEAA